MMKKSLSAILIVVLFVGLGCKPNASTPEKNSTGNSSIDALSEQIKANPKSASLYAKRAEAYYGADAYDLAIADMASAMKLDSNNIDYHILLADIYVESLQSRLALKTMERAVSLNPDKIPTLLKYAEMQLILQFHNESMETINKILFRDPLNADAFVLMGINFKETGDTTKAIVAFKKATNLKSELTDAWLNVALLKGAKNEKDALDYFNTAIRLDSTNAAILHAKAHYLQTLNQPDEALAIYRQIGILDPHYKDAFFNSALIYIEKDSLDKALELLNITTEITAIYPKAYYYRGYIFERKKDYESARKNYQQAASMSPSYKEAQEAVDRLKKLK
jgi:tetratricopeptide (TPR) repeat protein